MSREFPKGISFLCPSCSGRVIANSAVALCVVCPSCSAFIGRNGSAYLTERTGRTVPEDMTPQRQGTKGKYKDKPFEVAGRIRYEMDGAYCNRWLIVFNDDKWGWLEESCGDYTVLDTRVEMSTAQVKGAKPGNTITLKDNLEYAITRLDSNKGYTCEGDLPALPHSEPKFIRIELINGSKVVIADVHGKDEIVAWQGERLDLENLTLTQLRESNEWV